MSIIIPPSNHTRIGAWVNSKMSGRNPLDYSILCNSINRHARISHKHRRHGELGIGWVSMNGIYRWYRYRCRRDPGKILSRRL